MKNNRWIEAIGALFLIGAGMIFLLDNVGLLPDLQLLAWAALLLGGGVLFLLAFLFDRRQWWTLIAGFAMAGAGAATLMAGVLHLPGEIAVATIFASLAAGFAGVYLVRRRENWWALIPAAVTLLLAVIILLGAVMGELAGMALFLGIGLAFVGVYFAEIDGRRYHWWALIPAGALFSLAAVVLLAVLHLDALAGSALFLGLSLTFAVLYWLRGPGRPLDWAWIPSLALLAFGLFVLAVAGGPRSAGIVTALALIVGGLALALRPWRRPRRRLE